MKKMLEKARIPFLISFLFCFMLFIFGPAEIFFANVVEFQFVYGEFGGYLTVLALGVSVLMTVIGMLLPDKIKRIYLSLILGISVAGYLQVMFFNKQLDLLGLNPDGYHIAGGRALGNLIIWILIIAIILVISFWKYHIWKKAIVYISFLLLAMQGVAYVSLLITARDEAYHYPERGLHISGENQFQVSEDKNVIVIVLDHFSNEYIDRLNAAYPGATDFLHDFTYYSNYDCNYYGTYPSLVHMFTGCEVDMSKKVNDWFAEIWTSEKTTDFYTMLHENNYVANFYTTIDTMLCGMNGLELLEGKIDNLSSENLDYNVYNTLLLKTMMKMSAYRMFPELLKPQFYTRSSEYEDVVRVQNTELEVTHHQANLNAGLQRHGLTVDGEHNYFIVQHLMGTHEYTTDENGMYLEDRTLEETAKGCMVVIEEYLEELKRLGVYDDATIVITSDHGHWNVQPQVLFYIKQAGEHHEESPVNSAPVSHSELLATLAEAMGADDGQFGDSIYDFSPGEERERIFWSRIIDEDYPKVACYTGDKDGVENVYIGYIYTGDLEDLKKKIEEGPDIVVPMVDGYY